MKKIVAHERAALDGELRSHGLKRTPTRVAVLRVLRGARRPLTHPEIVAELEDEGHDRSTVYRALNDLAGAGLVDRVEPTETVYALRR
jgi:Fe2+ or Zn2+ uptake regulation protein